MKEKTVYNGATVKMIPLEMMFTKKSKVANKKDSKEQNDDFDELIVELTIFYSNGHKKIYTIPDIFLGFEFDKHYALTDIYGNSRTSLPSE